MKAGDLVRIVPGLNDEPDRYDGLVGVILDEIVDDEQLFQVRLFRLMVDGEVDWVMNEKDLEVINETR